jgi:hypothetical protein
MPGEINSYELLGQKGVSDRKSVCGQNPVSTTVNVEVLSFFWENEFGWNCA